MVLARFVHGRAGRLDRLERGHLADPPLPRGEEPGDRLGHLRRAGVHEHLVAVAVGIALAEFIDGHGDQRARRKDVLDTQAAHRVHARRQAVALAAPGPARMDLHVFRRPDPLRIVALWPERIGHHDGDALAVQHRRIVAGGAGPALVPGGVAVLERKGRVEEARGGIALPGRADALGRYRHQVGLVVGRLAQQHGPAGAIERAAFFAGQVDLAVGRGDGNALDTGDTRADEQLVEPGRAEPVRAIGHLCLPKRRVLLQCPAQMRARFLDRCSVARIVMRGLRGQARHARCGRLRLGLPA